MIYLLGLLLVFGLFQSLLALKENHSKIFRWEVKNILSILYIGGFIVGIIVIVIQNNESKNITKFIRDISSSISNIDSSSIERLNQINKTLDNTAYLIEVSDSIDDRMIEVIEIKDSLITQYHKVNIKLSQQLEIDKKGFEERAPILDLSSSDVSWESNDSVYYHIQACLTNFGKRSALITGGVGYVLFFDKDNKPFFNMDFPGSHSPTILASYKETERNICYISHGESNFTLLESKTYFAIICIKIDYKDILMDEDESAIYYTVWIPKSKSFGVPKDWQIRLAEKWATENHKF